MSSELMRYASGEVQVPKSDRAIAAQGKRVYDEVRLRGMQAEGSAALAGHIMRGLTELNAERVRLAGNDASLNLILSDVMVGAVRQAAAIQQSLYRPSWGL